MNLQNTAFEIGADFRGVGAVRQAEAASETAVGPFDSMITLVFLQDDSYQFLPGGTKTLKTNWHPPGGHSPAERILQLRREPGQKPLRPPHH